MDGVQDVTAVISAYDINSDLISGSVVKNNGGAAAGGSVVSYSGTYNVPRNACYVRICGFNNSIKVSIPYKTFKYTEDIDKLDNEVFVKKNLSFNC